MIGDYPADAYAVPCVVVGSLDYEWEPAAAVVAEYPAGGPPD